MMILAKRILIALVAMLTIASVSGCSMCCGPYDYHYPTFGGKHQRVDPVFGRVGSVFSDPLAGYSDANADSNLAPQPEFEPRDGDADDAGNSDGGSDDSRDSDGNDLPQLDSVNTTAAKYRRNGRYGY